MKVLMDGHAQQRQQLEDEPEPQTPTVLIVDDEQAIRDLLQDILEDEGFTVLTASDGYAALAIARQTAPSLILTDLMMPRMDGRALCLQLRADPSTANIPIVIMSAARNVPASGLCAGFIAKPFTLNDVVDQVYRYLSEA